MKWGRSRHPTFTQPCVRANDWTVLEVPALGSWQPRLTVSVVVPAHEPQHLHWVLAGLAAQTYPDHLLEVVVVDDGSDPPLVLPDVRPGNTRVVRVREGWGPSAARQAGADASEGAVIHWLDADMVPARDEVEAQLRWHHEIDYAVVLGDKLFVELDALERHTPEELRAALASGARAEDLVDGDAHPHAWIEAILEETQGLTTAGPRAMRVHVGATGSVGRDLFRASGGMPVDMITGEDIVLGYRLREVGGVFIPDREARSLHLGSSSLMRSGADVNRYNKPFVTDRVPEFRGHRLTSPRQYAVPYVEVVLDVTGETYENVRLAVDSILTGTVPDVVVSLIAPWQGLTEERRAVLADPRLDLRLVRAFYAADRRVRFLEEASPRCEATFRLTLPDAAAFPGGPSLERLLSTMEREHEGLTTIALGDGQRATLERTAAVERARRLAPEGTAYAAVLDAVAGTREVSLTGAGFVRAVEAVQARTLKGLVPWRTRL